MSSVIQDKIERLKDLCVKYRVKRLDLFGSAARDDFDPETSDLDFLVRSLSPLQAVYPFESERYREIRGAYPGNNSISLSA